MVFCSSEAPREIHVEEMGYLTEMKTSWNVPETTTLKSFKFLYPPQVFSYPETESYKKKPRNGQKSPASEVEDSLDKSHGRRKWWEVPQIDFEMIQWTDRDS